MSGRQRIDELRCEAKCAVEKAVREGFAKLEGTNVLRRHTLLTLSMMIQQGLRHALQMGTLAECSAPGFAVGDHPVEPGVDRLRVSVHYRTLSFTDKEVADVDFYIPNSVASVLREELEHDR